MTFIEWVKWLFKPEVPEIGDVYDMRDKDPFTTYRVKVVATKRGHVQYEFIPRIWTPTLSSCSIRMFHSIYRKSRDNNNE